MREINTEDTRNQGQRSSQNHSDGDKFSKETIKGKRRRSRRILRRRRRNRNEIIKMSSGFKKKSKTKNSIRSGWINRLAKPFSSKMIFSCKKSNHNFFFLLSLYYIYLWFVHCLFKVSFKLSMVNHSHHILS